MMWQVKIEDKAAEVFAGNELSGDDKIVIQKWAQIVMKDGPDALQRSPSVWADHPLHDDWKGYRASSFSHKGRIIYKVVNNVVTIIVVRITNDHDCKKEKG